MPGNTYALLPCAGRNTEPRYVTGANGLPLAKIARPPDHSYAWSAVHSAREVGFDNAKITGRELISLNRSTTAWVNVAGAPVAPISTCGLIASMASRNPRGRWSCAYGRLCAIRSERAFTTRPFTSTNHRRRRASSGPRPASTNAEVIRSAIPVAADPAPRNMIRRSLNGTPVMRVEEYTPARATAAVPWMSSLKQSTRSLYLFEQGVRVRRQEILELDQRIWIARLHGGHELFDQIEVRLALQPPARVAEVQHVAPQFLVVRPDVERDRQTGVWMDTGAGGIEREFSNGNAHAVGAEVAKAEDSLTVGDDDDADVPLRPVAQDLPDASAILRRDVEALGFPRDV